MTTKILVSASLAKRFFVLQLGILILGLDVFLYIGSKSGLLRTRIIHPAYEIFESVQEAFKSKATKPRSIIPNRIEVNFDSESNSTIIIQDGKKIEMKGSIYSPFPTPKLPTFGPKTYDAETQKKLDEFNKEFEEAKKRIMDGN